MTARREPSTPPVLPGYEPVRLLGMGGFADVFLYQQLMPRRSVAVKVLLTSHLDDDVRERFRTEADLMAQLSHHPSIVTVLHADVAGDGRPYLVMEYCSRPSLGQRYRSERMGVAEVLRIGVRLASAVETAHRAGILHRDIKPANVLVTDFGWPALTDFGIAATTGLAAGGAVGMSIPWSPPEMLAEEPQGDVRADVYSLAATVYSLLARRSPFEVPDGPNSAADLIARIERAPLAPTGRGDVPESLQAVLVRAMDRVPARRHHSALGFARALQQVEAELMLPPTSLDLPEDLPTTGTGPDATNAAPAADPEEVGQATRLRPVASISPDAQTESPAPPADSPPRTQTPPTAHSADDGPRYAGIPGPAPQFPSLGTPPAAASGATAETSTVAAAEHGVPEAWRRAADGGPPDGARTDGSPGANRRRNGRVVAAALAGVVVVGALGVAAATSFRPTDVPDPAATSSVVPTAPVVRAVPTPQDLVGTPTADGTVFTWTNPDPQEGDRYLWSEVRAGQVSAKQAVAEPTVTVIPEVPGSEVCVEVAVVRTDGRFSTTPAVACAEASA